MIQQGRIIKHERFLDVAFYVTMALPSSETSLRIMGVWLNQGFTESWIISKEQVTLNIDKNRLSEWLYCENDLAKCFRNEKWSRYVA